MSTYMRSGKNKRYLHRSDCPRYGWLARLLRRTTPWDWAEGQDVAFVFRAAVAEKLKFCPTCQPFGMRKIRSMR